MPLRISWCSILLLLVVMVVGSNKVLLAPLSSSSFSNYSVERNLRNQYAVRKSRLQADDVLFSMCQHDMDNLRNSHIHNNRFESSSILLGGILTCSDDMKHLSVEVMIVFNMNRKNIKRNTLVDTLVNEIYVSGLLFHDGDGGYVDTRTKCDITNEKDNEEFSAITISCLLPISHDEMNFILKTTSTSNAVVKILLEFSFLERNQWITLCQKNANTVLSKYLMNDTTNSNPFHNDRILQNRFYHSIVGCTKPLKNIDKLEKQWPGIMHQWIMYHVYIMGFGYISLYDVDGSAWEYVKDFVDLGLVRYYGPTHFLQYKHRSFDIDDLEMLEGQQQWDIMVSNNPTLKFLVDNHCVWDSKGSTKWLMLLRSPAYFVNDYDISGTTFLNMLHSKRGNDEIVLQLDIIQHDIRSLCCHTTAKKKTIQESFPFIRLPIYPKKMMIIVDPNKLTSLIDGELIDYHRSCDYNSLRLFVRHYPSLGMNVTMQPNTIGVSGTIRTDNTITVMMSHHWKQVETFHGILLSQLPRIQQPHNVKTAGNLLQLETFNTSSPNSHMKSLLIIAPSNHIPPIGYGPVENIIWHYIQELNKKPNFNASFISVKNTTHILDVAKRMKPDIIHIHFDPYSYLADQLSKIANLVLITLHDRLFMDPTVWNINTPMFSNAASIACRTNANIYFMILNAKHADILTTRWNIPSDRIYLIPNGVEVDHYQFANIPKYGHMSVCVGRINKIKGQYFLQGILNQDEIHFIGPNSPDLWPSSFNFSDPRYLGHWSKAQLFESLTNYGNLVHLATHEAASLAIIEALAAGLGVVTTLNASVNLNLSHPFITIVPDNRLDDKEYVVEAIRRNREIAVTMRDQIREYARQTFSWSEVIVPQYVQLVEALLIKQEEKRFPYNWALKYSRVQQMSLRIEITSSPYIAVLVVLDRYSSKLVDWIDSLQLIGVDHFLFFTYSHHREALTQLLNDYIVESVVELQYFDDFTYYQQLDTQGRSQVLDDRYFHILLNNEALSYFQIIGVTWMMLLFEQDYLFENMQSTAIVRDGLKYYLHQQDEREIDIIIQEGKMISKSNKRVSLIEDKSFHMNDNSRSIMRVATTVFHDELQVNCINMAHCSVDVVGADDNSRVSPIRLVSLDIDYAWELYDNGNGIISSADEEISMFVEGVSGIYQELSYLRREVMAVRGAYSNSNMIITSKDSFMLLVVLHLPTMKITGQQKRCFFQALSEMAHPVIVYSDAQTLVYIQEDRNTSNDIPNNVVFLLDSNKVDQLGGEPILSYTASPIDSLDTHSFTVSILPLLQYVHRKFPGYSYYSYLEYPFVDVGDSSCCVDFGTIDISQLFANKVVYSSAVYTWSSDVDRSVENENGRVFVIPNMLIKKLLQQLPYQSTAVDIFSQYPQLFVEVRPTLLASMKIM